MDGCACVWYELLGWTKGDTLSRLEAVGQNGREGCNRWEHWGAAARVLVVCACPWSTCLDEGPLLLSTRRASTCCLQLTLPL